MRARTRIAAALLAAVAAGAGCTVPPYTRAAGAFGKASGESSATLGTAPAFSVKICQKKAHLVYVQERLGLLVSTGTSWATWYEGSPAATMLVKGAPTRVPFRAYCAEFEAAGKVFTTAMGALGAYGAALGELAQAGTYDGADIKASVDDAAGILAALKDDKVAKPLRAAGDPLKSLATFIAQRHAEGEIEEIVAGADALLQPVLAGLTGYVAALDAELGDVEVLQRETSLAVEKRGLRPQACPAPAAPAELPLDPLRVVEVADFVQRTEDDLRATRAVLTGYKGVLQALRSAHAALTTAAREPGDHDLKKVTSTVVDLLNQAAALGAALTAK